MARVQWPDAIDEVIGGDLTAALAYVTPAGGAVATAVAPGPAATPVPPPRRAAFP